MWKGKKGSRKQKIHMKLSLGLKIPEIGSVSCLG
jgi:hypothetical protein